MISKDFRAQGAIEYLLIIGAAILVVAIVTIAITSILTTGQSQNLSAGTGSSNALSSLRRLAFVPMAGVSF